ncbi:MAG: glycoside hydrolase family 13 protein [Marinifilaceae bacterium]
MKKASIKQSLLVALFLLTTTFSALAGSVKLDRVEPMFWWAGMNNPELQLLVHGTNIADTKVEFTYPGVRLDKVTLVENPNYLFLNLIMDADVKPGSFKINFKKGKKVVASYNYELKARRKNSALRKGFDSSDVVYLTMPDRFSNGNPENDSVEGMEDKLDRENPDGRHGGDIQGIINHLDYLQELGITAIWNTPLMEDNEPKTSYHTYAISDFYKIDARYGTNEDYARLSAEAQKRGIKLIIDIVTNHSASAHWWMKDLPASDWVHPYVQSNHRKSTTNDPYGSELDYQENFDGWFDRSMPDLNQKNDLLLTYLTQNTIWWVEFADLGGVRVDTYPYNDKDAMAVYAAAIMNEYPNFNVVGETWLSTAAEISYWQEDALNHDGYNSHLPCVMDFSLLDAMSKAFNEKENWNSGLIRLYNSLAFDYLYPHPENLFTFIENHDTDRMMTVLDGDMRKYKMLMSFLLTTRGTPQLYYGGEILMDGRKSDGDGVMRKDFPGGWEGDERNAFTKEGRTDRENEAFDFLKKLLNYRKVNPVLHTGKLMHFIPKDETYVYFRSNEEKTVMVILNNSEEQEKNLPTARFEEAMKGFTSAVDVMTGEKLTDLSQIKVAAKSARVLELK